LKKYDKSRLFDSLITKLEVYEDGKIIVYNTDNVSKEYFASTDLVKGLMNYSADYILCSLQDNVEILVSKY
jgi:hypothetical protein